MDFVELREEVLVQQEGPVLEQAPEVLAVLSGYNGYKSQIRRRTTNGTPVMKKCMAIPGLKNEYKKLLSSTLTSVLTFDAIGGRQRETKG